MESWQQDWLKLFDTVTQGVHEWFEEVNRDLSEAADTLLNLSEEVADEIETSLEQIDQVLAPKLAQWDEQIGQWIDPVLQAVWGIEATLDRAVEPVTHTVEPWLNQHPVCIGCRHYHGQEYNGNLLICAMHPYGMGEGEESCPDKEQSTWSFPSPDRDPWEDHF